MFCPPFHKVLCPNCQALPNTQKKKVSNKLNANMVLQSNYISCWEVLNEWMNEWVPCFRTTMIFLLPWRSWVGDMPIISHGTMCNTLLQQFCYQNALLLLCNIQHSIFLCFHMLCVTSSYGWVCSWNDVLLRGVVSLASSEFCHLNLYLTMFV